MRSLRAWLRAVMGFSRVESNGFLILLPVMVLAIFSEPVYRWIINSRTEDFTSERASLDSLTNLFDSLDHVKPKLASFNEKSVVVFPFEPNRADDQTLKRLGFSNRLIKNINGYRKHGGKFYVKSDLLKIYGMDSTLYQSLYNVIQLPVTIPVLKKEFPIVNKESKLKFDLNTADTIQLIKIYGIGSKLATRIIKYRDKLGGFVSLEQLKEIYGLDSAVIVQVVKSSFLDANFRPTKIDINKITGQETKVHPYLTKTLSNAIASYRFQHGSFKNVEEIRGIQLVDKETADKLMPYLKTE